MKTAVIFNIMRYSIHDGPGIRTTVFFKGCPLSCKWCHNPESIAQEPLHLFNPAKCVKCGGCESWYAASSGKKPPLFGDNCPSGARETIGYETSVPELMKEINKDIPFYEQSGGGVTFSGGEPLFQAGFLIDILTQCREDYINTAIDTSGFCDTGSIIKAAELSSCVLYDIKFIDGEKHKKYCGASNEIILENLKHLARTKTKLLLRIPVIPSVNDSIGEMTGIFDFIKEIKNIDAVHLLPYHNIQTGKYNKIGMKYELPEINGKESPNMKEIKDLFAGRFRTKTGG